MKRDDVLIEVYGSKMWKNIKSDFIKEAKKVKTMRQQAEFFNKWSFYLFYETPMSTLKNRSREMKNELLKAGLKEDSPLLSFFKLDTKIYTYMNKKQNEKVIADFENANNENIKYSEVLKKLIDELMQSIENSKIDIKSNNSRVSRELAYQKLIVLALATGRRQIEILKTIEIAKKKDLVEYCGLAKKKDSDDDCILAPIFIDTRIAKKFLRDVREEFKTGDMTNKEVNSKYNYSISKSLHRYLPEEIAKKSFHFLRAIYAEACFEIFAKEGENKNIYFQKVLGHELNINAGHHYQAKLD